MNIAVINNSINPDMAIYFEAKKNINSKTLIFAANSFYSDKDQVHLSSISPKNKLTWHFFIDCLICVFLAVKLKFKGTSCLLFDNAHISNIPLAFAAKFLRLKLVFTIHDWNPHEGNMAGATRLYNRVVESFLADHFVVFSPIDSDVSYSVLKLSGFKSNFEKSNNSNQSFLFFGRVEPYKGLYNLVDIAKKVKCKMPDAVINVMGAGSDKAIESLLKLSNVNVVNEFINEEDLNSQLRKTTAVLLPYDSATQSGVVIKSFSMGIPVIAFDVGALKYYVDNGSDGILVRHGDIRSFVEAMIEISKNFTAFSNEAEKNFTKNYSEKALVNQYEELLLTLGEKLDQYK
jgi:glycosyltransferase involved in cell wall biosynthesis